MPDFFGVPKNVREAQKRQASGKNYSIQDKKLIINYYKNKEKKGKV